MIEDDESSGDDVASETIELSTVDTKADKKVDEKVDEKSGEPTAKSLLKNQNVKNPKKGEEIDSDGDSAINLASIQEM